MIFKYYPDSDMLYIELSKGFSAESEEVSKGIVFDFDEQNRVIGVDIEDASKLIDFTRLEFNSLPVSNLVLNAVKLTGT